MIIKPNKVITPQEAWELSQSWYFTGKPCRHGHVSTRNLHNGSCHECRRKTKAKVDPVKSEAQRRKEFHEQWMREFKERKANRKRALDLLS